MDMIFIFGARYLILLPILLVGIYFIRLPSTERLPKAVFAFSAALLTYITGVLASLVYFDPRPFVLGHFTPLIEHAADNGFPSDHALLAFALAMIGWYWNKRLGILLWVLGIVIGISRVYVGVHHPIDIIGSAIIAVVMTTLVYRVYGTKSAQSKNSTS